MLPTAKIEMEKKKFNLNEVLLLQLVIEWKKVEQFLVLFATVSIILMLITILSHIKLMAFEV